MLVIFISYIMKGERDLHERPELAEQIFLESCDSIWNVTRVSMYVCMCERDTHDMDMA